MPIILSLVLLLSILCLNTSAKAEHAPLTLHVAAYHIPDIIEEDGTGLYNRILDKVSERTSIKFKLDVLPIARARLLYNKGEYECLLPLDPMAEGKYFEHLQSIPLNTAYAYIFTKNATKPLTNISQLTGLQVGAELGVPYPDEIDLIIGKNRALNIETLVNMLLRDRFDAVIAYTPDMPALLKYKKLPPLAFDMDSPISSYNDSLTCRPSDKNFDILDRINQSLADIIINDE